MRLLGFVLVILGGLALGYWGGRGGDRGAPIPPVVSGIAIVGGLLLLVSADRRTEQ
jgi:hypothetical protein